ncbi:hypothetical protein M378DRAFT_12155 [Amanita muscaria Koide BX008]|uniref:Uncharacterized protein n=1 Tax=Amanita muscaria (strain Koide BX008) TaxID=946122 RepID=A0A0C2SJP2_AMAMK|nr:hypothetical protein M378DRAFT_12155 [Amanita muscaria Koide BX008]
MPDAFPIISSSGKASSIAQMLVPMTETDSRSDLVAFFVAEPTLASLTSPSFAHSHLLAPIVSVAVSGVSTA